MNTFESPHLMKVTPRPAAVMARGAGSYLWDEEGRQYLDFLQGWAVNCLGHCPPEVAHVLAEQAQTLITPSPALHNRPQLELAQQLISLSDFSAVNFSSSGAEANEAAVKLARKWGRLHKAGAFEVISTNNAFHGRTLAMMSASGKPGWDTMYPPTPSGFKKVPYGDIAAMRAAVTEHTVALMVEPIQGEAGVVVPPSPYLAGLRELADEHNLLLIFDEIQTGMGRTGTLFAYQGAGVLPDIMTLGKGLGAGLPVSAVLANDRANCFDHGEQGGTYSGNPLVCAVGKVVLDVVSDPGFLASVCRQEQRMVAGLAHLAEEFGFLEVRGRGLLYAVKLPVANAHEVTAKAFERGLLINPAQPDVLRFMPSLRVKDKEVDLFLSELAQCLRVTN